MWAGWAFFAGVLMVIIALDVVIIYALAVHGSELKSA
jgi:hypothetical protein